jgi:hypothetical protein
MSRRCSFAPVKRERVAERDACRPSGAAQVRQQPGAALGWAGPLSDIFFKNLL